MRAPPWDIDRSDRPFDGQVGLSLVEMLAALLVLGVLLSAFASSMVAFVREVNVNERRLLATQVLSQAQEDFQVIPFEVAGTFDDDVDLLDDVGVDLSDPDRPVFGDPANEVVTLPDPDNSGCPSGEPECGVPDGVRPAVEVVEVGGFEYTLYRVFTWVDRSGDGIEDVKRLTSIVRWSSLGRDYEERSDAERVATRREAGDPTELRAFATIGPTLTWLEPDTGTNNVPDNTGQNLRTLRAYVRFTQPVVSARLQFYSIDSITRDATGTVLTVDLQAQDLAMTGGATDPELGGGYIDFSLEIPPGSYAFTDGPRVFRIVGVPAGQPEVEALRSIEFTGSGLDFVDDVFSDPSLAPGDEDDPPPPPDDGLVPVSITDVSTNRTTVEVKSANDQLQCDLVVTAQVAGIYPTDGSVTISFVRIGEDSTQPFAASMQANGTIDPSGHTFTYTFTRNSKDVFEAGETVRFVVEARRTADPDSDGPVQSGTVRFTTSNPPGCS